MSQKARPYQTASTIGVKKAITAGSKMVLLVLPTGTGKTTVVAIWIHGAVIKGSFVIFLAHRRELIRNASKRLKMHGVKHGIIMPGERYDLSQQVQVGSVQSIIPRLYPKDEGTAAEPPRADIIVFDEAHRATSKSYKDIIAKYPNAIVIGLTATPARTDGRGLGDVFQAMVEVLDVADAIEQGYLCDYIMYEGQYDAPDDGLEVMADGEFDNQKAEKLLDTDELVGDVYANWKARAEGKRTIVFAQSRKHGRHIHEVFVAAGVKAAYIDGVTKNTERDQVLKNFEDGKIDVIINVQILVEGYDLEDIECIVLAYMTASIIKYRQSVGRGLRPMFLPGMPLDTAEQRLRAIALGPKPRGCIILDHGGNARHRFGGPDAPHEWSLDGRKKREAPVQPVRTECPICFAGVSSRTRVCPDCGHEFAAAPPKAALPDTADGMLVEANYKIRGSEKAEREKARIAALSEKERRAIEREQKRLAKAAAEEAKKQRIEDEVNFLRETIARAAGKGYNWKYPLMKFKERFRSEAKPQGYFPGPKHGVSIEYKGTGVINPATQRPGFEMIAFEFEGRRYGAPAGETP